MMGSLLVGCGQGQATITPPVSYALSDGWTATILVEPGAKPDQEFSVTFTITPAQKVSDVDVNILLPTGIQLISGNKTLSIPELSAHQEYITIIQLRINDLSKSHPIIIQALGTQADGYRANTGAAIYLNAVDDRIVTSTRPLYEITNLQVPAVPVPVLPDELPSNLTPLPKIRN